jgi:hypothetical protein
LYYKIFPENVSDLNDKRTRERATYPCHRSLNGSCSMGLIDNLGKDWLKSPKFPERYLTLIRLDRKPTLREQAKMKYFRYRLVFKSDVASYYANGWNPEDYPVDKLGVEPSMDFETKFWVSKKAPTIDGFVYDEPEERK